MSNLAPITEPDKIAAAIMASDALGLAGSSAMTGVLRVSYARELVLRIAAAKAAIASLPPALSPADDARWSVAEAEEETCRNALKELIVERLGVCPDDLWSAL